MTKERTSSPERELTGPVLLCDNRGRLNREAVGWSRRPLHRCNLSGRPLRKKRWNYWCVTTKRFLFSATVSDIDYLGMAFVYFLDFETKFFHEMTIATPFGRGCRLPDTVDGDVVFKHRQLEASFIREDEGSRIRVTCPAFGGRALAADILVCYPAGHETLNVVIPWDERRFQFTSKQNTLPVTGRVTLGDAAYDAAGGFACLDYGRGIWPYASFWNWAGASGVSGGHTIGLNCGAGWTDGTGLTENGICIDGVLTKLGEDLVFEYDNRDFMKPWTIRSARGSGLELCFEPFFERVARTDLQVLRSEVHQMIGRFSGSVVDAAGRQYTFQDITGWAEEHYARW
ncbi:MAG: DUF2804 domain-containing protein [Bacillota bacterium]